MPNYKRRRKVATYISTTVMLVTILLAVGILGGIEQDTITIGNGTLKLMALAIPGWLSFKMMDILGYIDK